MNANYLDHCCGDMRNILEDSNIRNILIYEADIREYSLVLYAEGKPTGLLKPLLYCPWCGKELLKELDEEWGNALKAEYGLTTKDFWDEKGNWDETKIPAEFRTDEWWKKRGL